MLAVRRDRAWYLATFFLAGLLTALYSYLVSRHRILWSDELFGWMLVSDPSLRHMLLAWNLGADGGGAGFYLLCRAWLAVFGHSLVAFRAFSAFWVYAGFVATWFALRRFYRPLIVSVVLLVVWFSSVTLLWQMLQTRFYGLLLGACAISLWAMLRTSAEVDQTGTTRQHTLLAVLAANLLLVSSHPFGFAYSLLILFGAALDDLRLGRKRPGFYIAAVLPWCVLFFSREALRNSQRVGKPWFWTSRPALAELVAVYQPYYHPFSFVLIGLGAALLFLLCQTRRRRVIVAQWRERGTILLPGLLFSAVPVVFWLVSQHGTSYFVDRYYCPFTIGVAILLAELTTQTLPDQLDWKRPLATSAVVLLSLFALRGAVKRVMIPFQSTLPYPGKDFTGDLAALLPRGLPVVFPRADMFDLMSFYRGSEGVDAVYPLDWPLALSPEAPRWVVSANHEMENWKLVGYFSGQIADSANFLKTHSHFIVATDSATPWFAWRIQRDPHWRVTHVATFQRYMWSCEIWDVARQGS